MNKVIRAEHRAIQKSLEDRIQLAIINECNAKGIPFIRSERGLETTYEYEQEFRAIKIKHYISGVKL